jgi:hypothetical protein
VRSGLDESNSENVRLKANRKHNKRYVLQ